MFEAALNDRDPAAAMMVGDRLTTDILGAKQMGIAAFLLRRKNERPLDHEIAATPDRVISSLTDLPNEDSFQDE
jgi:FMN phosphatase YigB (HAD superfamily)